MNYFIFPAKLNRKIIESLLYGINFELVNHKFNPTLLSLPIGAKFKYALIWIYVYVFIYTCVREKERERVYALNLTSKGKKWYHKI